MKKWTFRTGQEGAAAVLGPLESAVMNALWAIGGACSVAQVREQLAGEGRTLSYSAIKAVLNNLVEKGHLKKGAIGKVTLFQPKRGREEFTGEVVRSVIQSLRQNFGEAAMVQLVDEMASDPTALDEFDKLLAARRSEAK